MNRRLNIRGFKCFEDLVVPLSALTILCGPNSGGKSSIVQALLLYNLACSNSESWISVNGPYGLQLGDVDQLINRNSFGREGDEFSISVDPGRLIEFRTHADKRFLAYSTVDSDKREAVPLTYYIGAERVGPRISQTEFANLGAGNIDVGYAGQYTAEVLASSERIQVREQLRPVGKTDLVLLIPVVEYYLSEVFGPLQIQSRPNGNAPPSLYFRKREVQEEWTLSSNTGFGITYALPIIVAGLLCPQGSTLIIDGPEAHLHPQAQTAMAKFLCLVASSGVNVVIETHSDYIIEGARISARVKDGNISPRDCLILSIGMSGDGSRNIEALRISDQGSLSAWPKGFFDQHMINMREMLDAK